jgi:predicted phage-related endonuclease
VIIHDVPQRSDEWARLRLGKLTASRAADMMALLKSKGEPARRRDLRVQLAVEQLTHQSAERVYSNDDMQRGIDKEPEALAAAELVLGRAIHAVGFVEHDDLRAGCSPDGIIGDFEGLIEIKCPKSATHFSYWRARTSEPEWTLPSEYLYQVVHQLWITGAQWVEFVSFDDRFPPHLQLFHVRHTRDQAEIDSYELLARQFLREVEADVEAMEGLVPAA